MGRLLVILIRLGNLGKLWILEKCVHSWCWLKQRNFSHKWKQGYGMAMPGHSWEYTSKYCICNIRFYFIQMNNLAFFILFNSIRFSFICIVLLTEDIVLEHFNRKKIRYLFLISKTEAMATVAGLISLRWYREKNLEKNQTPQGAHPHLGDTDEWHYK